MALLVFHAIAVTAALHFLASTPRSGTLAHQVDLLIERVQASDSWRPMRAVRDYVREHGPDEMYEEVFFRQRRKFQYPPTSLLFIGNLQRPALNVLSWFAVWVTVVVTVYLFETVGRPAGSHWAARGILDRVLGSVAVAGLTLTFYPLLKAYSLGQIQVWIDAVFALLVWASVQRRQLLAGVMLGLICLVKPTYVLLAIWALGRGQRRMLAGAAATVGTGLAASLALYGIHSHVDYLKVLSYIGRRGEAFYPNQSFNGLFNRLFDNGSNLVWQSQDFPPVHWGVYVMTLAAGAALIAAVWILVPARARGSILDLSAASVTATVVAPIAWEHHYGILPPLFVVALPSILSARPFGKWTVALLVTSFVLTAQFFEVAQRLASTPFNVLQSYVLVGALMFLCLVVAAMKHRRLSRRLCSPLY
jgi:alpha-1,2-mannosyltransferase